MTYERQLARHYAAVRQRLSGTPARRPLPLIAPASPKCRARIVAHDYGLPASVRTVVAQVAARTGWTVETIMRAPKASRILFMVRAQCYAAVRAQVTVRGRPPSLSQLGRWFNRDRTTIVHALKVYHAEHR